VKKSSTAIAFLEGARQGDQFKYDIRPSLGGIASLRKLRKTLLIRSRRPLDEVLVRRVASASWVLPQSIVVEAIVTRSCGMV